LRRSRTVAVRMCSIFGAHCQQVKVGAHRHQVERPRSPRAMASQPWYFGPVHSGSVSRSFDDTPPIQA
jgi:hypothetical protein